MDAIDKANKDLFIILHSTIPLIIFKYDLFIKERPLILGGPVGVSVVGGVPHGTTYLTVNFLVVASATTLSPLMIRTWTQWSLPG